MTTIGRVEKVLVKQQERAARAGKRARAGDQLYPDKDIDELADALLPKGLRGADRKAALPRARADARIIIEDSRKRVRRAVKGVPAKDRPAAIRQANLASRKRARVIARTEKVRLKAAIQVPKRRAAGYRFVRLNDGAGSDTPCAAANGAVWTLAEYNRHPTEHPNCRRRVRRWLKRDPEGERLDYEGLHRG